MEDRGKRRKRKIKYAESNGSKVLVAFENDGKKAKKKGRGGNERFSSIHSSYYVHT